MRIPELFTQRKFVTAACHDHSNAHKPLKTVAPTIQILKFFWSRQYLSIDPKKNCPHLRVYRREMEHLILALLFAYLHFLLIPLADSRGTRL